MRMTKNRRQVLDMLSNGDSISSKDLLPLLSRQARYNVLERMWWAGLIERGKSKSVGVDRKDGQMHFVDMNHWVIANSE